jgi:hypothetical protein
MQPMRSHAHGVKGPSFFFFKIVGSHILVSRNWLELKWVWFVEPRQEFEPQFIFLNK